MCILVLLELRCPQVRGCSRGGLLINHKDGCKHMTASRHITTRHQAQKMMKVARKKLKEAVMAVHNRIPSHHNDARV